MQKPCQDNACYLLPNYIVKTRWNKFYLLELKATQRIQQNKMDTPEDILLFLSLSRGVHVGRKLQRQSIPLFPATHILSISWLVTENLNCHKKFSFSIPSQSFKEKEPSFLPFFFLSLKPFEKLQQARKTNINILICSSNNPAIVRILVPLLIAVSNWLWASYNLSDLPSRG